MKHLLRISTVMICATIALSIAFVGGYHIPEVYAQTNDFTYPARFFDDVAIQFGDDADFTQFFESSSGDLKFYQDKAGIATFTFENPSSAAAAVVGALITVKNDNGYYGGIGMTGSGSTINGGAFADTFQIYNQGYNDTLITVDGAKDFVFLTDPTDSHNFSFTEVARLDSDGNLGVTGKGTFDDDFEVTNGNILVRPSGGSMTPSGGANGVAVIGNSLSSYIANYILGGSGTGRSYQMMGHELDPDYSYIMADHSDDSMHFVNGASEYIEYTGAGHLILAPSATLTMQSAAGQHQYFDAGGTFYWRDADAGNANRMTLDSATGNLAVADLALNGGDLTAPGDLTVTPAGGDVIVNAHLRLDRIYGNTNNLVLNAASGTWEVSVGRFQGTRGLAVYAGDGTATKAHQLDGSGNGNNASLCQTGGTTTLGGTLAVNGNTITSPGDLTINPTGDDLFLVSDVVIGSGLSHLNVPNDGVGVQITAGAMEIGNITPAGDPGIGHVDVSGAMISQDINGDTVVGAGRDVYLTPDASGDVIMERNLLFDTAGEGLTYGEIYVKDSATDISLDADLPPVQVTNFSTVGLQNNMTGTIGAGTASDYITVSTDGIYMVNVSTSVSNTAAQAHVLDVSVYINSGATELGNVHSHRGLGGSADAGSISMSGIVSLTAADTVELWAQTDSTTARLVRFEDVTLSLTKIGG